MLLQNGSDRVVSLTWDGILAVATQTVVYVVDQEARKFWPLGDFFSLNTFQAAWQVGRSFRSQPKIRE